MKINFQTVLCFAVLQLRFGESTKTVPEFPNFGTKFQKGNFRCAKVMVIFMKLIHTADWHLCSPMECRLNAEKAEIRRRELLTRFADMIVYAKENAVDAVLMCGDLSDDGVLPYTVQDYLLSLIADAAPIRFFLIAGNHDRISDKNVGGCFTCGRRQMPENLTVFGDVWGVSAVSEQVLIHGRSLRGEVPASEIPAFPSDKYNIVMLHGEIAESASALGGEDERIPLGALRGRNIDYLALGHEHTFRHKKLDARGTWCYSGCPEGRGFDECGQHGFVVLTLDGVHCIGAAFVPFAKREIHDLSLDVSALGGGIYELEQALGSLTREIPSTDLVRVTLCGTDNVGQMLDLRYLQNRLSERFFFGELRDKRTATVDFAAMAADVSLRGAFVRAVTALELSEEEKNAVLRCGLAALDGRTDETLAREGDAI